MDRPALEKAQATLSLALKMQSGLADKICDRRYRQFRVYKQCFLHSDAVEWMVQHLKETTKEEEESRAVQALNEILEAGYVAHVCNHHQFTVNQTTMLYFRFHKDKILADMGVLQQQERGMPGDTLSLPKAADAIVPSTSSTASLQLTVDRLSEQLEKYSERLDKAHGKILILEEAVASLGFACSVALFLGILTLVYHYCVSLPPVLKRRPAILTSLAILLATIIRHRETSIRLLSVASQHLSVLVKLMQPSVEYEEAFLEDIQTQEQDDAFVVSDKNKKPPPARELPHRGGSVLLTMNQAFTSLRNLSTRKVVPRGGGIRMREAWDLPDEETWPHRPALLVLNTPVSPLLTVPKYGKGPCPIGVPFEFSSELFEGKCLVRLRDNPTDDPASDHEYFLGRRRRFQAIVQGRFKKELAVSDVLTGHEFVRSLQRLPPSWMLRAGTNLIRRLAPGVQIELHGENPFALSILAATSQAVSADEPGNEPDIRDANIPEDISLLGGVFSDGNTSASTRKRVLSNPDRTKQYTFDTESIYTFDFYQQLLDVATYSLDLGFTKLGISKNLDGQPIQVMSKTVDGKYLWSFQVWHEKLLEAHEKSK